jgi:hypothetical protein
VDVQVRNRIAEQIVVHVARREGLLDHPRDGVNVEPVRRDFCGGQACEGGDVAASEDDDRMTASDGVSLKVCVTGAPGVERLPELVSAEPAAPPLASGRPSPRAMFVSSALSLRSGDPPQCLSGERQILLGLVEQADDVVDAPVAIGHPAPPSVDLGDVYGRWNGLAGVDARPL